jgi:predicted TIM-barrel fold metal-dependent hydrolase
MLCWISLAIILAGCYETQAELTTASRGIQVVPYAVYQSDPSCSTKMETLRKSMDAGAPLYDRYKDLTVIDAHYHGFAILIPNSWNKYNIDRTALFWAISEPRARFTDMLSWWAYRLHPDRVYPYFAGIPIYDPQGLTITRENLEQGYMGIGEIVGASTDSPVASVMEWKSKHPNDGNLPEIYDLAAAYRVPVLLHVDPPRGYVIQMLEQAMVEHPHTLFVFGHANAYNPPENIEDLMSRHSNLYIDIFAGFTAYNPDSSNKLGDFAPLIEQHPDRFFISTDGGYDLGYDHAALAMYELLDLLTPQTACRVAYQNLEQIMEMQLPTEAQVARIQELSRLLGESGTKKLNKRIANELIFELENKVDEKMAGYSLIGIFFALLVARCIRAVRKIDLLAKRRERAAWLILSILLWVIGGYFSLAVGRYDLAGLISGFEVAFLVIISPIVTPIGMWWQFWLWSRKQKANRSSGDSA